MLEEPYDPFGGERATGAAEAGRPSFRKRLPPAMPEIEARGLEDWRQPGRSGRGEGTDPCSVPHDAVISRCMTTRFTWDVEKAASNRSKHRVSFDLAIRVFADPFAISVQDRIEAGEMRWQTIGAVEGHTLLVVAHTVRDDDGTDVIRIISARRADRTERRRYEEGNR